GHHKAARLHRAQHVVRVLEQSPGIQQQAPKTREFNCAGGCYAVAGGVLHPRIGGDDQVARHPGAEENEKRAPPVADASELFFSEQEEAQECGFQEKGENSFHRQGLSNHAASGAREQRPISSELELHGNASDDAEGKVNTENSCPEARGAIVVFITGAQSEGLQNEDEEGKAHGQLREEIVKCDSEGELKSVHVKGRVHANTSLRARCTSGLEAGVERSGSVRAKV